MTAVTVAEAGIITRAKNLLAAAELLLDTAEPGTITPQGRASIREHIHWLTNSLQVHARLTLPPGHPDYLHPASEYPWLAEGHPDNALEQALDLAADDIKADTTVLADVIAGQTSSDEEGERAA